jgi:hypothetical protein
MSQDRKRAARLFEIEYQQNRASHEAEGVSVEDFVASKLRELDEQDAAAKDTPAEEVEGDQAYHGKHPKHAPQKRHKS